MQDDAKLLLSDIGVKFSMFIPQYIIGTFLKNFGLKITIITNLKLVNLLDVTFDLCTGKYQPYKKPNNTSTYINVNSKHAPNIIKPLLDSISKRISNTSATKATFNNAASFYNDVLSTSGYKENLIYQKDQPPSNKVRASPLERNCLDKELIYQCSLEENNTSDGVNYNGVTENTFKDRFYKHRNSFKDESKVNSTELLYQIISGKRK